MTKADLRILFIALGYLAVVLKLDEKSDDRDVNARTMAGLIEKYSRWAIPEAFDELSDCEDSGYTLLGIDGLIDTYKHKAKDLEDLEEAMPKRRSILLLMHQVLEQRAGNGARHALPDKLLAKLITQLIQDEIQREEREL